MLRSLAFMKAYFISLDFVLLLWWPGISRKPQKMRGVRLLLVLRNLLLCIFFFSCLRSEYVSKLNVECQQNVVLRPSNWFFVHTTTMTILYQHSKHLMTNDKKSLIFIGQAPCVILTIGFVYKIPIMIQDKIHLDFK